MTAYDVEIKEIHHVHKIDAPSGTAITLANDLIANMRTVKKNGNLNKASAIRCIENYGCTRR